MSGPDHCIMPPTAIEYHPFSMTDDEILEQICPTHVHSDTTLDAASLFSISDTILIRSDTIVQTKLQGSQGSVEQTEFKALKPGFISPLCLLRKIGFEMCCKPVGEASAWETTFAILQRLTSYEWPAKAVLTLAAFAVEYGEFWFLVQQSQNADQVLSNSLGIMKLVPELIKTDALAKNRNAIMEISTIATVIRKVVSIIIDFDTHNKGDTKDLSALGPVLKQLPINVFWVIITTAAVVTQIDCLTTNSGKMDLSLFGPKINSILNSLNKHMERVKLQFDDSKYYKILISLFQTATEITEVFKMMIFGNEIQPCPVFYQASTTTELVTIEVLKKKDVLLFISTLEVTHEEISILNPIYERIKEEDKFKLVWVPFVEEWNPDLEKKFEELSSKMPWYSLKYFKTIKSIKFIREEWLFKKTPMVVVLNSKGAIMHKNAFHMIQVWRGKCYPFTQQREDELTNSSTWINSLVTGFSKKITWEEKHVIIFGGTNQEWTQKFRERTTTLTKDTVITNANVAIQLVCLQDEEKTVVNNFWKATQSLYVTKMNTTTNTVVTKQVGKLLSYREEAGWAILTKGRDVVVVGHETAIMETVESFEQWKTNISTQTTTTTAAAATTTATTTATATKRVFHIAFQEHHEVICKRSKVHVCCHLEIPNVAGKIPDNLQCPHCQLQMEVVIKYRCCPVDPNITLPAPPAQNSDPNNTPQPPADNSDPNTTPQPPAPQNSDPNTTPQPSAPQSSDPNNTAQPPAENSECITPSPAQIAS